MIVCLCHRISDREIAHAVGCGTRSFEALQDETGLASSCGLCRDCARQVFDDACAAQAAAQVADLAAAAA
jgi:bacterioferritin-associated ferredoxin